MTKKKESGSGLMSSAGLMRYYDADETKMYLDPKHVVIMGVTAGVLVLALNINFGLWP